MNTVFVVAAHLQGAFTRDRQVGLGIDHGIRIIFPGSGVVCAVAYRIGGAGCAVKNNLVSVYHVQRGTAGIRDVCVIENEPNRVAVSGFNLDLPLVFAGEFVRASLRDGQGVIFNGNAVRCGGV